MRKLGREKGDKTEKWPLIIAILAGELKETEVRNSHSLQLNNEAFAVLFYFVCLIGEGTGM